MSEEGPYRNLNLGVLQPVPSRQEAVVQNLLVPLEIDSERAENQPLLLIQKKRPSCCLRLLR